MNTHRLVLVLLVAALLGSGASLAEDKDVSAEPLGELALGQDSKVILKLLGQPTAKGKDTLWEAIGEWVQDWEFSKQGLTLGMASTEKGGAKTLHSITAGAGCQLATARRIKIGSTEAEVNQAYAKERDKEQSLPGKTFVAGSVYGGVIFTFKNGKVGEIFIGAAAE
jgi:hypothetical protein